MAYIHQLETWPEFEWSAKAIADQLAAVRHRQGKMLGRMQALGFEMREQAVLATLTEDVLKSSEIEGEILDKDQVRSSVARRLGLDVGALPHGDRHVEGVVEMMLDATQKFDQPLTRARLFGWHAALFPTGYSGMNKIVVGNWRDGNAGPMQVVSGPYGREKIHYEAPDAELLPAEMDAFLRWFNGKSDMDPVLKAAVAHLWFVTIHPFEDGNGRIARALADMALARSEESPQRFYSMSAQIRQERKTYYDRLEATQKGDLEITSWLTWFLACLDRAFDGAETILASVLRKARFWEAWAGEPFNERQRKVLNRFLDGFEGKLQTGKYAALAKTSTDTAGRDISDLLGRGVLRREEGGGRNTSYDLITSGEEAVTALAHYCRLHAEQFSPPSKTQLPKAAIDDARQQLRSLADELFDLSKSPRLSYLEVEARMPRLHAIGCFPDKGLITAVARFLRNQ